MRRLAYLDGWRGLAVGAVLIGHFTNLHLLETGRLGVELFFVLSGRLMAEILFEREKNLPEFFLRRITRIFPTMLAFLAVAFVASQFVPQYRIRPSLALASVFMLANYAQFWTQPSGLLNHLWSLCVEEHLYLLLGSIAFVQRRVRSLPVAPTIMLLAGACAANGVVSTLVGQDYYSVYWRSDVRGASILMGAAAHLLLGNRPTRSWVPALLIVAGVALNAEVLPDPVKYTLGTACLAGAVALLPNLGEPILIAGESRVLTSLGMVSFSVYLWQQPFALLGHKIVRFLPVFVLPALVAGVASYFLIEKPTRKWLNALISMSLASAKPNARVRAPRPAV